MLPAQIVITVFFEAMVWQNKLVFVRGKFLKPIQNLQMGPSVRNAINDLSAKHRRDHCGLVRSTCAFLLHVCEDEYQLYRQFFYSDSQQFKWVLKKYWRSYLSLGR